MASECSHEQNRNHYQVAVVMVPFPLQSHLNMLLNLSRIIVSYNIPVHYASSSRHNQQVKHRSQIDKPDQKEPIIHFHDLYLPPCSYYNQQSSDDLLPLHRVLPLLRGPVFDLLQELARTYDKIVIIYDGLMTSVIQDAKSIRKAEAYSFHGPPPFTILSSAWERIPKLYKLFLRFLFSLRGLADLLNIISKCEHPTFKNHHLYTPDFGEFVTREVELTLYLESGSLYNINRLADEKYMDILQIAALLGRRTSFKTLLSSHKDYRLFALGHFNPIPAILEADSKTKQHRCLKWLDQHERGSVIYVSFGTLVSMNDNQVRELAIGLERSGHKFLWVLRKPDKGDRWEADDDDQVIDHKTIDVLPEGFIERVRDQGLIETNWAPQLDILAHPSVGGFMSHCGWGSCMESMTIGVPIAAWPLHFDQPWNSVLVTRVLKVGLPVADWEVISKGMVTSYMVENATKNLMGSEQGERLRKRAAELGHDIRESMAEGGASRLEMDAFIAHILRPC